MQVQSQSTYFDPRVLPEQAYNPQAIQTHYIERSSLSGMNWRRSYDDGDLTPTNEIMEAKNDTSSGGGTLPRQRQAKRSISNKIDLPTPLQLFNTDYTAEARKQMSMYYSTPSSTDMNAIRRQSGSLTDNELCQKVEKCYIDGPSVHYGRTSLPVSQFQSPYHQHQIMYGGNFGKLYAGQFQTQAEVHVEQNSQIEVCMVS
jgi:hypothetical protein